MKKILLSGILFSLLFFGCKDEKTDYASLIIGKWVNTQVNNVPILTDASYVSDFKTNMIQLYATGFQLDENNRTWMENENYTYSVKNNVIIIDGTNVLKSDYHMEFEILSVDENTLVYSIKKFTVDNVEYPDTNTYTCKKVKTDYSEKFTGIWYGKCTTVGTTDTQFHYWEYFSNGTYNYYYKNDAQNWIKKSDNEGKYFLYGNMFVSNYSNDLVAGGTGKAFECWNFEINGTQMIWTGLRANGKTVTYEMNKVASPPEL